MNHEPARQRASEEGQSLKHFLATYRNSLVTGGISVFVAGVLWTYAVDLNPLLRGPLEWRWGYNAAGQIVFTDLILTLEVSAAIILMYSLAHNRRTEPYAVVVMVCLAFALQLTVGGLRKNGIPVLLRPLDYNSYGYFNPAKWIGDIDQFLRQYSDLSENFRKIEYMRVLTHPPGFVLINWLFIQLHIAIPGLDDAVRRLTQSLYPSIALNSIDLVDTPALSVTLFCGVMVAFSAAFFGKLGKAAKGPELGLPLLLLWIFTPAIPLHFGLMDQLVPVFTVICLLTTYLALSQKKFVYALLLGLVGSIGTIMTIGFLVIMCMVGTAFLGELFLIKRLTPREFAILVGGLALGFALIWVVYWIVWGVNPITFIWALLGVRQVQWVAARSYWTWQLFDPVQLLLYSGIPAAILFLIELGYLISDLWHGREVCLLRRILLGCSALLVLLLLSGSIRGEVERNSLFLMPIIVLGAGLLAERWRLSSTTLIWLALLQLFQTVVFQIFIRNFP